MSKSTQKILLSIQTTTLQKFLLKKKQKPRSASRNPCQCLFALTTSSTFSCNNLKGLIYTSLLTLGLIQVHDHKSNISDNSTITFCKKDTLPTPLSYIPKRRACACEQNQEFKNCHQVFHQAPLKSPNCPSPLF